MVGMPPVVSPKQSFSPDECHQPNVGLDPGCEPLKIDEELFEDQDLTSTSENGKNTADGDEKNEDSQSPVQR